MKKISGISIQSWILVLIQFICLIILLSTGPVIADNLYFLFIEIIGIALGIWSVFVMSPTTINVFPDVRKEASFVRIGPYRFIRHPMYLAVLMFSLSLLLESYSLLRFIVFLTLMADLFYKIEYEEKILNSNYPGFKEYCAGTKKLVPYIY